MCCNLYMRSWYTCKVHSLTQQQCVYICPTGVYTLVGYCILVHLVSDVYIIRSAVFLKLLDPITCLTSSCLPPLLGGCFRIYAANVIELV